MAFSRQIFTAMSSSLFARHRTVISGFSSAAAFMCDRVNGLINNQNKQHYVTLPRLPVPNLQKTKERFLKVTRLLVAEDEYTKTKKLTEEFFKPDGEAETLQKLLEERAERTENWLSDWWLDYGYLYLRNALPVNLSPGILFSKLNFSGPQGQIDAAAELTRIYLMYKDLIDTGQIKTDMAGKLPMDMTQYPLLFGTNRIPGDTKDRLRYGKDEKSPIRHVVVARNGHLFKVDIYDNAGNALSISQIGGQLQKCVEQAQTGNPHPVGICTSQDRTPWAKTYESLKKSSINSSNLEYLETSLFIVALDKPTQPLEGYSEFEEHGRMMMHGGGPKSNSGNRWFDKTIQLIVNINGYAGMTYEHSPAEGPPVAALADYAVEHFEAGTARDLEDAAGSYNEPKRLDFELTEQDKNDIEAAGKRIEGVAADVDIRLFKFEEFGKNFPKSQKVSPDSFCQLALQLTYYKMHKYHPVTYETGTLRTFHLGRTDTIRFPTDASGAFSEAMLTDKPDVEKTELFRKAVASHKEYMVAAMTMNGIDRHFLGFGLIANENGLPRPEILNSPAYVRMMHFNLSTSQVPTKHNINFSFGPSAPDCYAVCYNPQEVTMNLMVTSFNHFKGTDSRRFGDLLCESFHDIREVLEGGSKSKL